MNQLKRVIYIISDVQKALAFEWTADFLKGKYDLYFILVGEPNTELARYLHQSNIQCFEVTPPQFSSAASIWYRVFLIILRVKPDIVHMHLWRATLLGLPAAWLLGVKQRIFTRHHAMLHYDEYPSGRKWDRLCNFLATDIVAISENIRRILIEKESVRPDKVHLINHGFDLAYFKVVQPERVARLRSKYPIQDVKGPVIGVIARYTERKGIQFIIAAFKQVLEVYPDAHLILANAHGEYADHLRGMLSTLPRSAYTEIRYESDLAALYKLFNVYVHVPVDVAYESFGQTYIESLAAGVPSVFTLSGVAPEFIRDQHNALVVGYSNSTGIGAAILRILEDANLREQLISAGYESVRRFSKNVMFGKLEELYG